MQNTTIPVLGFAAFSGTGKTTLLTQLIPLLTENGLSVGLIKHSHHNFEIDKPGKDSFQLRKAGASQVMLVSGYKRAIITEFERLTPLCLNDQIKLLDQTLLDIILVEGFKSEQFPKIEIHRPDLNKPLLYPQDSSIIAVASNSHLNIPDNLILLDLNNPQQIADFILQFFPGLKHD